MKRETFKVLIVAIVVVFLATSCEKTENIKPLVQEESAPTSSETSNLKATSVNWNYSATSLILKKKIWVVPGTFVINVGNSGNRNATVRIFPMTTSDVDLGNIIAVLPVPYGLTYSIRRTYTIPAGYSGVEIWITKEAPSGGEAKGLLMFN